MDHGQGWLLLREPERRRLRVLAFVFAALVALSLVWNTVSGNEIGGQFVGACFVAWIALELRVRTWVTEDGLCARAELSTRRVRWEDVKIIDTDHPGHWATAVVARTDDGSTVRLRGVRPEELDDVRAAWREAVGP